MRFGHGISSRLIVTLAVVFVAMLSVPAILRAQDAPAAPDGSLGVDAWPGEYIVVLDPAAGDVTAATAQLAAGGELVDQVTACGSGTVLQVWRASAGQPAAIAVAAAVNPAVRSIEPNWIVRAAGDAPAIPEIPFTFDDYYYASHQWPSQRSSFARAWQLAQDFKLPANKVRVAVIDSGVDFDHPDLAGRLLDGINYFDRDILPADGFGHGTHVTGVIAAIANNSQGIAGGAPNVEIDPLKMLNDTAGSGSLTNLVQAICDAADRGADVINMSLEVPASISISLIQEMQAAADYAYGKGAVLVAAGGNSSGQQVLLPARLNNVIAVAALTVDNTRPSYGPIGTQLDIAAGGGDTINPVISTWPSSAISKCAGTGRQLYFDGSAYYCAEAGTSMAAPHVAAAAALLLSVQPDLSNSMVESILEETARDVGLPATQAGAGLLDAEAALRRVMRSSMDVRPALAGALVAPGAAPFTTTVAINSPSLAPMSVVGMMAPADWFEVVNVAGTAFTSTLTNGAPLYLTVAISPTNLVTGTYTSTVALTGTRSDLSKVEMGVPLFVTVADFNQALYLPAIVNDGSTQPSAPLVPYEWETPVDPVTYTLGSADWVTVTLPFVFPLTGQDSSAASYYSDAVLYADGFVAFPRAAGGTVADPSTNQCLPLFEAPTQAIFGWWADLDPSLGDGEVSTFQPTTDKFVIQYKDVSSGAGVSEPYSVTFQIVLYANGNIRLNYQDVPPRVAQSLWELTPEVTVGVQANNGLFHNQVSCVTLTDGFGLPPESHQSILFERGDIY